MKPKLESLMKSWNEVKDKIEECIKDKNFEEHKEKVLKFVDKAKDELTEVIANDVLPLVEEGKKKATKIQKKLEKARFFNFEEEKKKTTKKAAPKKKPAAKAKKK